MSSATSTQRSSSPSRNSSPGAVGTSRRRSRSDSLEHEEDQPPARKKRVPADARVRHGKHAARTILIKFQAYELLQYGVEIYMKESTGEIPALPTNDTKFKNFLSVIQLIPGGKRKLEEDVDSAWLEETADYLDLGSSTARSDDTSKLKGAICDFIGPCIPKIPRNSKTTRGFHHNETAALLCPPRYDIKDPEIRKKLKEETLCPKTSDWPPFLYKDSVIHSTDLRKGLFRSELLLKAAKAIFISPSAADSLETASRSTRKGNAALNGMREVTIPTIAYIAAQVRFALSSDEVFGQQSQGRFDLYLFYRNIIKFLKSPRLEEWVGALLQYWNMMLFSGEHDEGSDNEDSTAAAIFQQMDEDGSDA